jgi:hypothetical protein
LYAFLMSHACYIPSPSHSHSYHHSNII